MKFSEKLQILRKENKLSQEGLADKLDVSRQSVSKWESGQTYPEMDKLIMMCKIFKCSLDDLTNDEVKEVNFSSKQKTNISNLIDEVLNIIDKSIQMFKRMNPRSIAKLIIEMCILLIILAILKIPFNLVNELGSSVFFSLGDKVGMAFSSLWNFIIEIAYLVIWIIIVVYIYKTRYLDNYENISGDESLEDNDEEISEENEAKLKNEKKPEDNKIEKVKKENSYVIFEVLGKIIMWIVKVIVFFIGIPFIFILVALFCALVVGVLLLSKGVFYIGIILSVISWIILTILFLELVFNFMFNRKANAKRTFVAFIISIAVFGASIGFTMLDVSNTTYIDEAPVAENITIKQEYQFKNNMFVVSYFEEPTYVINNQLKNNIKIESTYYKGYASVYFDLSENGKITVEKYYEDNVLFKRFFDLVIKDLSKREIHNYEKLFDFNIRIYASEKNIKVMKENKSAYEQALNEISYQNELDNCERNLNNTNSTINDLETEKSNLQEDLDEARNEIEEYKYKIQEYKDKINEILGL